MLSVILPVYNGLPFLRAAMDSVLHQSFTDFELIVINDGSSDGSAQLLETFNDPRIRLSHQKNRGLATTLNIAICQARGRYIARQDQDDVCLPDRFAKQVAFLNANPKVGLLGTAAEIWVGADKTERVLRHPAKNSELQFGLLFNNYFVHSSVMLRKEVFDVVGNYVEDPLLQPPEDYELWSRVARNYQVANLPDVLLAYREVVGSMSRSGDRPFLRNLIRICADNLGHASEQSSFNPSVLGLANLLHDRYGSIPPGVRLPALLDVIEQAAAGVGRRVHADAGELEVAKRKKLREVRYRYIDYKCGGALSGLLRSRLGVMAKKMLLPSRQKVR